MIIMFHIIDVLARQSAKHGSRQGRRATAHKLLTERKQSGMLSFDHLERPPSTSPFGNSDYSL